MHYKANEVNQLQKTTIDVISIRQIEIKITMTSLVYDTIKISIM